MMYLDTPQTDKRIFYENIFISGWAFSESGIKEIQIYFDNEYYGSANYGEQRIDVGVAYSDICNSGFSATLSLKQKIYFDTFEIKVCAISNNDIQEEVTRKLQIDYVPNIENLRPMLMELSRIDVNRDNSVNTLNKAVFAMMGIFNSLSQLKNQVLEIERSPYI